MNHEHSRQSTLLGIGRRSRWLVAELIVIIAGVLIALGIDEWRGNREDAALERVYLAQIINELQSTETRLADVASINEPFDRATTDLLSAFQSKVRPDLDVVRRMLFEFPQFDSGVPQLSTIESMISAGDLRLIRDSNVRAQISRYLTFARDGWMVPVSQREDDHRELVSRILVIAQSYGMSPSYRNGHVRNDTGPNYEPDVEAFFNDTEAYAHVSYFAQNREIMLQGYRGQLDASARQLRQSLENYLATL